MKLYRVIKAHILHISFLEVNSSGYYSYMWSEVLDADTFNEFKKSGDLFNPELAKKYREMLASGGSKPGMQLYTDFLGREPQIEPLLRKKGFLE